MARVGFEIKISKGGGVVRIGDGLPRWMGGSGVRG